MKQLCSILVLCIGLAGCASTAFEPQWLSEARGRELEPLPQQQIRSQDRFFRAVVPANLTAPSDRQEDAYHARLDIGTEAAFYANTLSGLGARSRGLTRRSSPS